MASQSNPSQRDTVETESSGQVFNIAEQRIRVLGGSTETSAAFQIDHEGHTLGNALRYMIMKNPKVDFCGYTIPHPAEDRINIRIQTAEGGEGAPPSYMDSENLKANEGSKIENYSAYDALEKGFNDLMDLCDVVTETFTDARDAHQDKA